MNQQYATHKKYPLRVPAEIAAEILGCATHDIRILVSKGLLIPLGNPSRSAVKYFSTVDLLAKASETAWLNKITACLYKHWQQNHANRKQSKD